MMLYHISPLGTSHTPTISHWAVNSPCYKEVSVAVTVGTQYHIIELKSGKAPRSHLDSELTNAISLHNLVTIFS